MAGVRYLASQKVARRHFASPSDALPIAWLGRSGDIVNMTSHGKKHMFLNVWFFGVCERGYTVHPLSLWSLAILAQS